MNRKAVIPPIFDAHKVSAFFTTRTEGNGPESALETAALHHSAVYLPMQKHTDKIVVVDYDLGPKIADAVVTNRAGILIGIQVADCVPVLLYDTKKHAVAAVHAGWRGTAAEILKKTISTMSSRFYSSPDDILIAVGPSIKSCCYEVGHEVAEGVHKATGKGDYMKKKGGKYYLDLPSANRQQALAAGVPEENIWLSDECTFCMPDKYYSYRFAKGTTGRQYGFIGVGE